MKIEMKSGVYFTQNKLRGSVWVEIAINGNTEHYTSTEVSSVEEMKKALRELKKEARQWASQYLERYFAWKKAISTLFGEEGIRREVIYDGEGE